MSERVGPLIIAHRGASADCPENTREAFLEAASQGADMVELDVRHTVDEAMIVHHDAWYRDGRSVWLTPSHECPSGIVTLDAALDACAEGARLRGRPMSVNVEIKNIRGDLGENDDAYSMEFPEKVLEVLLARIDAGSGEHFVVSSFDPDTIDRVRERSDLDTAQLVMDLNGWPDAIASTAERGHRFLHPWDPFVDEALIAEAHGRRLGVNTWTVDAHDRVAELAAMGVDGVVTNVPAAARRALG